MTCIVIVDSETGLYNSRSFGVGALKVSQYYDPSLSLWLGVDPLADMFPGWNPYHYVHNNPINLIDPTGMSAQDPNCDDCPMKTTGPTATITAQRGPTISQDNTGIAPLAMPSRINEIRGENGDDYWKIKSGATGTKYLTNKEMYSAVSGTNSQVEFNILRGQYGMEHAHGVFQHGIKQAISDGYDLMSIPVYAVVPLPFLSGFGGVSIYGWKGLSYGSHELTIGYRASTGIGMSYRHTNSLRTMALDFHTLHHYTGNYMPVLHGHYAQKGVWSIDKHLSPGAMLRNFSGLNKGISTPGHKKTALYKNLRQAIIGN